MNRWLKQMLDWLLMRDLVTGSNTATQGSAPETGDNDGNEGMVSQEVFKKKIVDMNAPDALEKRETVFETANGVSSYKKETLIRCACGRLVPEPFALCTQCEMPICSPEHFLQCHVCQAGICPKCVRFFKISEENGKERYVPLCEKHNAVSTLSGKLGREWS
jgi:hypothetical protein